MKETFLVAKQSEWDIQEAMRKAAKESVDKANNNNVARMLQEKTAPDVTTNRSGSRQEEAPTVIPDEDETLRILANCQISLALTDLLKLVPRFTEKVAEPLSQEKSWKMCW